MIPIRCQMIWDKLLFKMITSSTFCSFMWTKRLFSIFCISEICVFMRILTQLGENNMATFNSWKLALLWGALELVWCWLWLPYLCPVWHKSTKTMPKVAYGRGSLCFSVFCEGWIVCLFVQVHNLSLIGQQIKRLLDIHIEEEALVPLMPVKFWLTFG